MKYIPSLDGLDELEQDPEYIEGLRKIGLDVRDRAFYVKHKIMPRKSHQQVEVTEIDGRIFVVNTDYGGHLDEYGSVNNPPYAPLRTAVRAAGLRLEESSE